MGHFDSYPTEEERDAALIDQETGKRWPEGEIWAVAEDETLYHIFRMKQFNQRKRRWAVGCASDPCDRIYRKCDHQAVLDKALDAEWERFLNWQDAQLRDAQDQNAQQQDAQQHDSQQPDSQEA